MSSKVNTAEGRKWLMDMLKAGPMRIIFTKKDGTERVMNCTLKPELTENYEKKTERVKEVSPDICPVFDLDVKSWRSFRYDSVKTIELDL